MPTRPAPPALNEDDARVSLSWPHYNYLRRWRPAKVGAICFGLGTLCGAASCIVGWLLNH